MRRGALISVLTVLAAWLPASAASGDSLWSGSGERPGPPILYAPPAVAPELTNTAPWSASPILVSGTTAYRSGEFLYQDYLYDDHGAREQADPADQRASGDTFSKPNGTYTYPTGPGYDNDAADLVEFRVKPLSASTAFRVTLNTLQNPGLVAFSVVIGGTPGTTYPFPDGANVSAPASLFLTVHPQAGTQTLVGDLVHAGSDTPVAGPSPTVTVDTHRRQIQVTIPHSDWNPGSSTVRLAMGVGLWNNTTNRYLLPGPTATATTPGGSGTDLAPAAFFNVAFRTHEPLPSVTGGTSELTNAAWWRDEDQGTALAGHDISSLYADVDFAKLNARTTDNSAIPTSGPMDRILASHFEIAQGAQFADQCGFGGAAEPSTCQPEYEGQLEPYAVYIPSGSPPAGGWGMTLLLHSLSANYNQYSGSRNQAQFANRSDPSIVITPEARGPDQFYEGYAAAEVFEAWADIADRYPLNPAYADITGYSMGGMGTYKLGSQFPDLFARAQPTVGYETNNDVLASLRNVPVLAWNNSADELVTAADYGPTAAKLQSLGYRYELDVFEPCATSPNPTLCSPLFPNHLELAVNDQFAPAAAFLGSATVNPNPPHVTYVYDTERDRPTLGIVADHAYWVSGLTLRSPAHLGANGDPEGEIDARSLGFGQGDPAPSGLQPGTGTLTGGNLGPLVYASSKQTWAAAPNAAAQNTINITATNIATATIDPDRAHVNCNATLNITSDGPIAVTLAGCQRTVQAG